ncbi:MAG: fumarylacetoacetate hydrolase family protein [Gammaproteobacteria bacterium]|jgi:2-keto-4-pentenoate hydratase/2-oxohepta-3-ene-1,7-dioic acid hydratase in catechol pathway
MKLATLLFENRLNLAVVDAYWDEPGEGRVLLLNTLSGWPKYIDSMQAVIEHAAKTIPLIEKLAADAGDQAWLLISSVQLCAPIPEPKRNILCLGWNYAEHAKESSSAKGVHIEELPQHPIVFTKATTTVNGPFDNIVYNDQVSRRLDWEVELGVIVGKKGRHIQPQDALDYVFGYTVINDVSARDLQKRHQQFFLGKSMDGTCPMGPWIVTAGEIADPQNLPLRCLVNGVVKQQASTNQQIFPVANVISTLSSVMTLLPGDIIATGTPSGVGFARTPPEYLTPGDVVECEVRGIGRIINKIVQGA